MSNTETKTTTSIKSPSHYAYQVSDSKGDKAFWTKIGAAWAHADSNGFNIQLESIPLDGRVTLRTATERKE